MGTEHLVDFLLARFAEDEAVAREASEPHTWAGSAGTNGWTNVRGTDALASTWITQIERATDARHIARHDPARVLAECEAKRQILDLTMHGCGDDFERVRRALALPYADHPDWRKKWRP